MDNKRVINHTSVDDIKSSLQFINPETAGEIKSNRSYLVRSIEYELKNQKRVTVVKMLRAKVKKLDKLREL
jgi:hypothetical protein